MSSVRSKRRKFFHWLGVAKGERKYSVVLEVCRKIADLVGKSENRLDRPVAALFCSDGAKN